MQKDGITYILNGIEHDATHVKVLKQSLAHAELVVGEPCMGNIYAAPNYVEQPRNDEIKYVPSMFDLTRYLLAEAVPSASIFRQLKTVLGAAGWTIFESLQLSKSVKHLSYRNSKQKEIKERYMKA